MKNAILLHGLPGKEEYYDQSIPSASNAHWFPWFQNQLLTQDIKADTPEIPHPYKMIWDDWVREVERFDIGENTILVGHSMGGGFWVRYLSEHPKLKVFKVILVAPWLNLSHEEDSSFFDFKLNPKVTEQAKDFIIFASDNDSNDVQNSVKFLQKELKNFEYREFREYGHFTHKNLPTDEFPELLEECLKN